MKSTNFCFESIGGWGRSLSLKGVVVVTDTAVVWARAGPAASAEESAIAGSRTEASHFREKRQSGKGKSPIREGVNRGRLCRCVAGLSIDGPFTTGGDSSILAH